jgi:hypothetical protein
LTRVTTHQSYIPTYQQDIFISFSDEDTVWANSLIDYLASQLKQKLATADGFRLHIGNDFNQLSKSATLLIIISPAYCQQYKSQFKQLEQFVKQQNLFLVEYKLCDPRPEFLKGFTWNKFWSHDENQGYIPIANDDFVSKANKLASAIAQKLIELKAQAQRELDFEQERERESQKSIKQTSVFLNCAPEDLALSRKIKSLLKEKGVNCVIVPMEQHPDKTSAEDTRQIEEDIKLKISRCDAVLVLYEQTEPYWASKQIMDCLRLRDKPLKILALHKSKNKPDLGYDDLVMTYECPPKTIETYLPEFIEAL